jgi:glycosyltransferase involved in cell wall biosynthesis
MKRILMVAFHFPPLHGSSGIQRTLRFARHLREFGWEPIILTADPRAYAATANDQLADVPLGVHVQRAFALDTSRHLAIAGRYPEFLARPDRWKSWWLGAVPAGLRLVRRFAPHIVWSTYPIATAHAIGATLQRMTGLPWVADFRDPMAQEGYPEDPRTWRAYKSIEERVTSHAARLVFTTHGAMRAYRARYPSVPPERFCVVENGYDEEAFGDACKGDPVALNAGALTLLHSGIVYPKERDPTRLMQALRKLVDRGAIEPSRIRLRFRAAINEGLVRQLAKTAGVESMVEVLPPIDYRSALDEMQRADALLILQADNCNEQIPAKLYEYLRARRPILALTDPAGDTAATLRNAGLDAIRPLDDVDAIVELLEAFLRNPTSERGRIAAESIVAANSRRRRTAELATLLDEVAASRSISRPNIQSHRAA